MRLKSLQILWLTGALLMPSPLRAQLEMVDGGTPQAVFARDSRAVRLVFHNGGSQAIEANLRSQLFQASSATAIPIGEPKTWKKLAVLPGQTVIESATRDFPPVNAGTRFVMEWIDDAKKVVGRSDLMVYPTNLLEGLKPAAAKTAIGVFDPDNALKPVLKAQRIEFEDLEVGGLRGYPGHLVLIGPAPAAARLPEDFGGKIAALAQTGAAVVWIKPQASPPPELEPLMYVVHAGSGALTIVRPSIVANLAESPVAQLNLVRAATMAAQPDMLTLAGDRP